VINIFLDINFGIREKSQYDLVRQIVDENSDYYIEFSNEFIKVFDKNHPTVNEKGYYSGAYPLHVVYSELKDEINTDLVSYESKLIYINTEQGAMRYVDIEYPYVINSYDFLFGLTMTSQIWYSVIYVPVEYLSHDNLVDILGDDYCDLYRKGGLFIVKRHLVVI
jgi:hypothetical protein